MDDKSNAVVCTSVNNILDKWQLTDAEKMKILGFNAETELDIFTQNLNTLENTLEMEMRSSLILNIHAELRQLFNNSDNVYGFMKMINHNAPFFGRRPLDLACSGVDGLDSVFQAFLQMRHF